MKELWTAWNAIGAPLRQKYSRFIQLQNKGAQELGFKDMGAMWRSNYDMTPEQFSAELERLWNQVRPFYESLHAYVRTRISKQYGRPGCYKGRSYQGRPAGKSMGPGMEQHLPAHVGCGRETGYNLTEILTQKKIDERGMVRDGENFFKSLGFAPLPQTFWERSLFVKPRDREVVCHASAWDVDNKNNLRVENVHSDP